MKKALSLILALVLCMGLCACGAGNSGATKPEATVDEQTFTEMSAVLAGEWGFYLEDNTKYQYYVFNADKTCSWVTVAIDQESQEHVVETTWTGTYVITDKEVVLTLAYDGGSATHTTRLTYAYLDGNMSLSGVKYIPQKGDWTEMRNAIGDETPDENPGETPEENPGETPEENPGETPEENPGETPDENPGETPEETPGETPEETPEETPDAEVTE